MYHLPMCVFAAHITDILTLWLTSPRTNLNYLGELHSATGSILWVTFINFLHLIIIKKKTIKLAQLNFEPRLNYCSFFTIRHQYRILIVECMWAMVFAQKKNWVVCTHQKFRKSAVVWPRRGKEFAPILQRVCRAAVDR